MMVVSAGFCVLLNLFLVNCFLNISPKVKICLESAIMEINMQNLEIQIIQFNDPPGSCAIWLNTEVHLQDG